MSNEVFLAGYTDRLSGRPGSTIGFFVSSQSKGPMEARLTRSICADPNPQGPGIIEEDASQWFAPVTIPSRYQPILSGSCAVTEEPLLLPPENLTAQVSLWVYPTLLSLKTDDGSSNKIESPKKKKKEKYQFIWSWGQVSLCLNQQGCLVANFPTTTGGRGPVPFLESSHPLKCHQWYQITLHMNSMKNSSEISIYRQKTKQQTSETGFLPLDCLRPLEGPFWLATGGTFSGKLESPHITTDEGKILASWDTSKNMSGWTIPPSSSSETTAATNPKGEADVDKARGGGKNNAVSQLELLVHPTRGVRGHNWDGSEMCWRHKPEHYAAIYFHPDDVYDFFWDCDFEWTIPTDMPSGIYIMRLSVVDQNGKTHEEALPLFICPPLQPSLPPAEKQSPKKKLCILISTFTYVMYGNHARADFEPNTWMARTKEWNGYLHNPSQYPKYGCSTYNFHSDGSGICFASHHRPLFNVRPGFCAFGSSSCSGLRHFPADSHLIAWLHHHNIAYDIVTDHELHKEGVDAIAGYQTLMTGSHPEYHSLETLNALQSFRDDYGGNLIYLGGDGFYWRVTAQDSDASLLEIRRAEDGVRTWASEPGESYHALDGTYGGLWRRNARPPQQLVGVGFAAQGSFTGMPYRRVCFDSRMDWVFDGIDREETILGNFGFSGNGAAGFELDRTDRQLDGDDHEIVILAQARADENDEFMLVPEEVLTTYSTTSGLSKNDARRADMVYFETFSGAKVFSVGSITFCGSLPWNNFDNNISKIVKNIVERFSANEN